MLAMAGRDGVAIAEVRQESHSAKNSGSRPVYQQLISDIRVGKFQGILTWAPDRLSRNAGDLGSLVDLMDQKKLIEIKTNSQVFHNTANEKFLLMILCSQAKLENDNRATNILRGMKTKNQMGWRPCMAPLGYLNQKYAKMGEKKVFLDPVRASIIREMFERVAYQGMTGRQILRWLTYEKKFTSRTDKKIPLSSVYKILENPFYYGEYEYPIGSGNFYQGEHEPLISRELFDQVRLKMVVPEKPKYRSKEFSFTRLMKCGGCGYGITATERKKKQKNGREHRYVYYHCTNKGIIACREPYIREEELILQLIALIHKVAINSETVAERLKGEIDRFLAFSRGVLNQKQELVPSTNEDELRNYLLYLLSHGNREDKREVLSLLESKLYLKDGILELREDPIKKVSMQTKIPKELAR